MIRLTPAGEVDPEFAVSLGDKGVFFTFLLLDDRGRAIVGGDFKTINGVERPGVARVFAYDPKPQAPLVVLNTARERIATNEVLYLGAQVTGFPPPELQWYRNGQKLISATNRVLRLPVENGTELGDFQLVATNSMGSSETTRTDVALAVRSPVPGSIDPLLQIPLTNFNNGFTQLVPLPDGRIMVGAGGYALTDQAGPLVGRLLSDGRLDSTFGDQGIVRGKGTVDGIVPLPNGSLLVVGSLSELAGNPVSGIAELGPDGNLIPRAWPDLDIAHISTVLPLAEGGWLIAGRFTRVAASPAHRLARLKSDRTVDPTFNSPLQAWQLADVLAQDSKGRLLIAGDGIYSDVVLTNAPSLGLLRLRADGSPDPLFRRLADPIRYLVVESTGTLLVGMPAKRLTEDGEVVTEFESVGGFGYRFGGDFYSRHLLVTSPEGGVSIPIVQSTGPVQLQLLRWNGDGSRDYNFVSIVRSNTTVGPRVAAATRLSDGSLLLAMDVSYYAGTPEAQIPRPYLQRILPDADQRLTNPHVSQDRFQTELATQLGKRYEILQWNQLGSGEAKPVSTLSGDGYVQRIVLPHTGDSQFIRSRSAAND